MDILLSISLDRFADTIPRNSQVDLLIGSDYFWSIIGVEKTTLPSGLFLVSSRIGYIMTGSYSYPTVDGGTHSQQQSSSFLIMMQVNCTVLVVNRLTCSKIQ